jgi:arabinogalactan oligomer/maltooligosaccharide transport system substrate-binding protein
VTIVLWTAEGKTNGGLQFVRSLTEDYATLNPNVAFDLISKDVESLREDFLNAGVAGKTPDLLWTVNAHVHPFVEVELLMPIDDRFDIDRYVESASAAVRLDGQIWGLPINSGGHLMLIYNKDLIERPPRTTDELVAMGMTLTTDDQYGLVYNQTDPQWLVPWLGGFAGSVFAEDGTTPTLNTQEMVNTLQFLYDLRTTTPIVPEDSDYEGAHILFTRGEAAMIINGDWSLSSYKQAFGDKLGVARIPQVSTTGEWPHPYTSGTYFMFPVNTASDQVKLEAVTDFAKFVTSAENQELLVTELNRLPTLKEALEAPAILDDPILKGSADQMIVSRPEPTVSEMRCNWDAMTPEMQAALSGDKLPEEAAVDMQQAAESCTQRLGE